MSVLYIKKSDGTFESFDIKKIERSLKNSGASKKIIEYVIKQINEVVYDGISSDKIYNFINDILGKKEKRAYLRYNLPNAVAQLGPEGFAFEALLVEIVKKLGYKKVFQGRKIKGKCMVHELDVVGENEEEKITIESKFHNSRSKKSDFQVILYMKARFDDLEAGGYYGDKKSRRMIVTNTKFTDNAKKYAKCSGLEVLSWNYPRNKNLHDYILESGVHPITALKKIPKGAKRELLNKRIVTIKQMSENDFKALRELKSIPRKKINEVIDEVNEFFVV